MKLTVEYVPISSIKEYSNNAKKHTEEQIDQIVKSINDIGFADPIGVWQNEIVEGHGRYLAAKKLNLNEIPIIRLDELTDEQRRAYALIHNKLTMNTEFDVDLLMSELDKIESIDMTEFDFELFSIDDIEEVAGYDKNTDKREHFSTKFTFPIEHKEKVLKYLRKHKKEIIDDIIQKTLKT